MSHQRQFRICMFFYIYSNFLTLYKKYEWSICICKFHPFLFLKSHTKFLKFSLVKHLMKKNFLISSLIEISFRKGILPKDSCTKVSYTVLGLASRYYPFSKRWMSTGPQWG